GGLEHAGQAIEEGALAGPVRTDDGAHLVALNLEVDLGKRGQAAESYGQQFGLEYRSRRRCPAIRWGAYVVDRFHAHLRSGELAGRRNDRLFLRHHFEQME